MINHFILAVIMTTGHGFRFLNPKGPVHETYAIKCLEEIATSQFNLTNIRLLTVMVTQGISSPGYNIQQNLLKRLNTAMKFNTEVIKDDRNWFGVEMYMRYCIIVVDDVKTLRKKMSVALKINSSNPRGDFLVYYSKLVEDHKGTAKVILEILWKNFIKNAIVLIPKTLRQFGLYTMDFAFRHGRHCLSATGVRDLDNCTNGVLTRPRRYYRSKINHALNNCTFDVVAIKVHPFVIDKDNGFEIDFIREIAKRINVSLNINISKFDFWGELDEDGNWSNGLSLVQEKDYLGIGNFLSNPAYDEAFRFTFPHFSSSLIWIVPIAAYVPKWRVLIAIFSWYSWLFCIGIFVACGIFLKITSRTKRELPSYKYLGYDFLVAFQTIIITAVARHPRSDLTRIVFVSVAVFSIIISSVYTSSLIQFLRYPQREHQISTIEGVLDVGWDIGGLPMYAALFENTPPSDTVSPRINAIFQSNESQDIWLSSVADDRDTCALGSEFSIKYMLAEQEKSVVENGKPKIFILRKHVYTYLVSIVMNKGFPFLLRLNEVISKIFTHGVIKGMIAKYTYILGRIPEMEEETGSAQKLSVDHLQGAFAIVIFGNSFGLMAFLGEILVNCIVGRSKRKKQPKRRRVIARRTR